LEAVTGGIIFGLIIIVILEICRYFRRVGRSFREIEELKKKVEQIEELLRSQDNK
jgi:hypothetical protein